MANKLIPIPKRLADALDTYYQTAQFARQHFTKFNRELTHRGIVDQAEKLGYTVTMSEGKNAGQFVFQRESRTLRVTRKNFPMAEVMV